jgi:hypothetical protein
VQGRWRGIGRRAHSSSSLRDISAMHPAFGHTTGTYGHSRARWECIAPRLPTHWHPALRIWQKVSRLEVSRSARRSGLSSPARNSARHSGHSGFSASHVCTHGSQKMCLRGDEGVRTARRRRRAATHARPVPRGQRRAPVLWGRAFTLPGGVQRGAQRTRSQCALGV